MMDAAPAESPRRPLFFALGTRGDLQPMVPLAIAMRDAGWEPLLVSQKHHASVATAHGLSFEALIDWKFASDYADHESHFEEWALFYDTHKPAMIKRLAELVAQYRIDHVYFEPFVDHEMLASLRKLGLPVVSFYFAPKLWLPGTRT